MQEFKRIDQAPARYTGLVDGEAPSGEIVGV